MNIQVERLENQEALITVELDEKYLDQAKRKAATALSSRYRIPGFRKGKAPYNVVQTMLGEGAIMELAVDQIADDIYPKALKQSGLSPYAPGTLENVDMEPAPVYRFRVVLQPEVELGDYHTVRVPYAEPTVTDEDVDAAIRGARKPARVPFEGETLEADLFVTLDVHAKMADGEERPADAPQDAQTEDGTPILYLGDEWLHAHDQTVKLNRDDEPFMNGFVDQMIGQKVGDTIEFELTADEDDELIAGRKVHFEVTIKKAEVELPVELNDELAAELTKNENPPLNLEQLRERVRGNLLARRLNDYKQSYSTQVIDAVVAQSTLRYPAKMVDERVDEMVNDLKTNMAQQGISYDFYKQVLNLTDEQIRENYRAEAEQFVRRSLVVGEVVNRENLRATANEIDNEINAMLINQTPKDAARLRSHFNRREQREEIARSLVTQKMFEFFVALGKGEAVAAANPAVGDA